MNILEWGYPILLWIQNLGDWLLRPMQVFTAMGNEMFFMTIMPILLWSYDALLGIEIGLLLLFSLGFNAVVKIAIGLPRPYWVNPAIRVVDGSPGFGVPSGHAQNAFVMWGQIAYRLRRRIITALCIVLIVMISISRWYLGLHFPTDTIVGWLLAALILVLYNRFRQPLGSFLRRQPVSLQIGLALLTAVSLAAAGWLIADLRQPPADLPAWEQAALASAPDSEPIQPLSPEAAISSAGAWFGLAAGSVLLLSWGGYSVKGAPVQHLARILIGIVCLLGLQFGLDAIFPDGPTMTAALFRFLRYAILGFWASYLAPRVFTALKLTAHDETA